MNIRWLRFVSVALVVTACGGSAKRSVVQPADSTGANADKIIGTLLDAVTGARGKKVDAPGKVRFLNLVRTGDATTDIDVWWGQPDEGDKAATITYGAITDYLTPKTVKGFDSAVYSVTAKGDTKVLWSWDRFSPKADTSRTVMMFPSDDGVAVSESDVDDAPGKKDYLGVEYFGPPDSGKVRVLWMPIGRSLDIPGKILEVAPASGGTCFTNGSGIAGPDGNQIDGSTFQVAPGTKLALFDTCGATPATGTPVSAAVDVPGPSGRVMLVAYLGPGDKPTLLTVAVRG